MMKKATQESHHAVDVEAVLSLLEDAIDFMPEEENSAYREALRKCPEIVKKESDPSEFLFFEDYNIWTASRRLVNYWEWRKKVFKERAFLPMLDLTGFGACDEGALNGIRTWTLVKLPPDAHGDAVVLIDRSRLQGSSPQSVDQKGLCIAPQTVARYGLQIAFWCLDYVRHELRSHGNDMTKVGIGYLDLMFGLPNCLKRKQSWETLVKDALPLKLKWIRLLCLEKEKEQKTWFKALLPSVSMAFLKRFPFTSVDVLSYGSKESMKRKLISLGLSEAGLPPSLGGTWSYDSFYQELQEKNMIMPSCLHDDSQTSQLTCISEREPLNLPLPDKNATQSLQKSLPLEEELDIIPFSEKVSLMKAKDSALEVYQAESCQLQFHRFHNFDSKAAAEHLAEYWSIRDKLFSDRAFLRMNQLGIGALSKDGIRSLHSEFLMLLPKDKQGNFVLSYDPSKATAYNVPSQRRCLFYVLYLLTEQSLPQAANVRVLLRLFANTKVSDLVSNNRRFLDVAEAFPFNFVTFHVILESKESVVDGSKYQQELQTDLFKIPKEKIIFHTIKPGGDITAELGEHGLNKDNIPDFLGGNWTPECFLRWRDGIIRDEVYNRSNFKAKEESDPVEIAMQHQGIFFKHSPARKRVHLQPGSGVAQKKSKIANGYSPNSNPAVQFDAQYFSFGTAAAAYSQLESSDRSGSSNVQSQSPMFHNDGSMHQSGTSPHNNQAGSYNDLSFQNISQHEQRGELMVPSHLNNTSVSPVVTTSPCVKLTSMISGFQGYRSLSPNSRINVNNYWRFPMNGTQQEENNSQN